MMTDQESTGTESMGSYSLDDEDQLQPEDTLDDRGVDDLLDEGYSPPERPRGVDAFGNTFEDIDADSDRVGEDDPDSIAAEDDFLGDPEAGDRRCGRLMAPDEGAHADTESDMVALDMGIDGGGCSAEEAAMHIVEDHPR